MFNTLLKDKKFLSEVKNWWKQHQKEILDIIIFGSVMRGKRMPKDIDILLLFKEKENLETAYVLRKKLQKIQPEINVTTKTYQSVMSKSFLAREAYLSEGYSLIMKKWVAEAWGYTPYTLFKYRLKGWPQSKRMQFQYSLYGRNKEGGMVKMLKLVKFADTIILSPRERTEETRAYLTQWNMTFQEFPILLPSKIFPSTRM